MEFSRPGYWSGYPFPSPGDLPNPGIELGNWTQQSGKSDPGIGSSPALQVNSLPTELEFFTTIVPHELTANQKNNCHFEVSSLILYNKKPFLNQTVTCDKKWTLYNHQQQPAQWPDQEAAPKHFPNQTSTKKKKKKAYKKQSRALFGGLLSIWTTTAFWILAKPLHLRSMFSKSEMHWKLQHLKSCTGQEDGPNPSPRRRPTDCMSHNQHLKIWTNWAIKFYLTHHIQPAFSPTDEHFFKHDNFLQGKCFHSQQEIENAFQEFIKSQSTGF